MGCRNRGLIPAYNWQSSLHSFRRGEGFVPASRRDRPNISWSCCPSSCRSRSGVSLRTRRSHNRNFRRHDRWRTSFFVRVSPSRSGRNSRRRWRRGPWAGCRLTSTCWGYRNRRRPRRSRRSSEPLRQPTRHSRCRCRRRFPRRERRYSWQLPQLPSVHVWVPCSQAPVEGPHGRVSPAVQSHSSSTMPSQSLSSPSHMSSEAGVVSP